MESLSKWNLASAGTSLKVLVTCFVLALGVAYSISLLQVKARTDFNREQTIRHFRGSENFSEIYVPQSDHTMISVAHVHSFSQPAILFLLSFLFLLTGFSERSKSFWILTAFLGSFLNIVSPWMVRDVSPQAVYLLYLSGLAMWVSFLVMASSILYATWKKG